MSSIQNVITTTFRAQGSQAIAQMGYVANGMGRIGNQISQNTRMSERLNYQWRAFGTTIRYAIAGGTIFGLVRMKQELGEIQRQMSLMEALGGARGGIFPNTGMSITAIMKDARQEAVRSVVPVREFDEGIINLFSSLENVPENQAAKMMREISLAAKFAQVDTLAASTAITGAIQTFGLPQNVQTMQRFNRVISEIFGAVPGGPETGRAFFTHMPQLAAAIQMGHGTLPDVLGMYMTLLRTGGSAATQGRGLAFMLQTLAFPNQQVAESRNALASVGITPEFIEAQGSTAALLRLMKAVRNAGVNVSPRARAMSDDELEMATAAAGDDPLKAAEMAGITGPGAVLAARAFRRIHALRAFVLLATRFDQLTQDMDTVSENWAGTAETIKKAADRQKALTDRQKINQAGIALEAFREQMLLTFEPLLNLGATGIIKAQKFAADNDSTVNKVAVGSAAFLAAIGIGKFIGFRSLLGKTGQAFVTAQAAQDAMTQAGMGLGASPQNPLYVIVVGQIFGGGTRGPGGVGGGIVENAAETYLLGKLGKRAIGATRRLGRRVLGKADDVNFSTSYTKQLGRGARGAGKFGFIGAGLEALIFPDDASAAAGQFDPQADARYRLNQERIRRAQEIWGQNVRGIGQFQMNNLNGVAEVRMTIKVDQGGKIVEKRVIIPAQIWSGGRSPSAGGRAGSRRIG